MTRVVKMVDVRGKTWVFDVGRIVAVIEVNDGESHVHLDSSLRLTVKGSPEDVLDGIGIRVRDPSERPRRMGLSERDRAAVERARAGGAGDLESSREGT